MAAVTEWRHDCPSNGVIDYRLPTGERPVCPNCGVLEPKLVDNKAENPGPQAIKEEAETK